MKTLILLALIVPLSSFAQDEQPKKKERFGHKLARGASAFLGGYSKAYNANTANQVHCVTTGGPGYYTTRCN